MAHKALWMALIFLLAIIGTFYASWAIEEHMEPNLFFMVSSIVAAPPVLLYAIWPGPRPAYFWVVFFLIEVIYVAMVLRIVWAIMNRQRNRNGVER